MSFQPVSEEFAHQVAKAYELASVFRFLRLYGPIYLALCNPPKAFKGRP